MGSLTPHLRAAFGSAFDKIRKGELRTLIPFLCLFRLNGKPMNLKLHYQFAPIFNTTQAANTCVMTGRQVGKSNQMVASTLLRSMLIPYYHTMLVQPRMDQIQRLISTVYKPLLGSCPIREEFISSAEYQKMALREFRNGSLCYAEHLFNTPDRTRGAGNLATVLFDESVPGYTELCVVENGRLTHKKITDIRAGDVLVSFANSVDETILSVASKNASFHGYRSCFRIKTAAGRTLDCTLDHPLATSEGSLRVSEIVEHEHNRRGKTGWSDRAADKCSDGESDGGFSIPCVRGNDEGNILHTWSYAAGIHKPQIHPIERCRYETTKIEEEQRVCEILRRTSTEEPWGVSLLVFPAISCRSSKENYNRGISESDNPPDSSGLVVSGRWEPVTSDPQGSDNKHSRVLQGRSTTSVQLDVYSLENQDRCKVRENEIWENRLVFETSCSRYMELYTADKGLCSELHGVQNKLFTTGMSAVRKNLPTRDKKTILLRKMQKTGGTGSRCQKKQETLRKAEGATSALQEGASDYQAWERPLRADGGTSRKTASCDQRERKTGKRDKTAFKAFSKTEQDDTGAERSLDTESKGAEKSRILEANKRAERQAKRESKGKKEKFNSGAGAEREINSICKHSSILGQKAETDRITSIEYIGVLPVYDVEVVGTHNYILANGICSYNCQDIEYEFLDIVNETMSASLFWGFSMYLGTPKTTDTTLALLWNRSSQAEWIIPCSACNYFNIPNPDHDLLKMIGKQGPVCAKCGRPINIASGGYVSAIPDRLLSFPGYHISQTIHPLHANNPSKWRRLLDKMDAYSEMTLFNEVFGWPLDSAVSPLTMADMQKAANDIMCSTPEEAGRLSRDYKYVTVGVDWSGGGMISDSYTAFAVLGLRKDSDVVDVIHGERLPKGLSPSDEADRILAWIAGSNADAFAYDNGGAGFARLEIMKHRGLSEIDGLTVVPINYVAPHAGDVMKPHANMREPDMYYYTLDKSRSLAVCIMAVKAGRLRMPKFKEEDQNAYQRDFLALREDPRTSLRNEVVILISKKPGVPDDFAHAVNFGCSQLWDHFGAYPRIGSRYDTSALDYDENNHKIMEDDVFGPRGDFERFRDAVNMRATYIETGDDYDY